MCLSRCRHPIYRERKYIDVSSRFEHLTFSERKTSMFVSRFEHEAFPEIANIDVFLVLNTLLLQGEKTSMSDPFCHGLGRFKI